MSTRIGSNTRTGLQNSVDMLLGRAHRAVPYPIPVDAENIECHNKLLPEKLLQSLDTLTAANYDIGAHRQGNSHFIAIVGGQAYDVFLGLMGATPVRSSGYLPLPTDDHGYIAICEDDLARAYMGHWHELRHWITTAAPLRSDMIKAHVTATEIINMISTAGQLKRMVPEMIQYLPTETQGALAQQVRASSVPYEWSSFDRASVRHMLMCMAKCYLLPPAAGGWNDHPAHVAMVREKAYG